jgi:hypothetical protein
MLDPNKLFYLKSEIAEACGVTSLVVLRREIQHLIDTRQINWDNPGKVKGTKGGRKLVTRKDALKILQFLGAEIR